MTDAVPASASPYIGPPLPLTSDEIIELGSCVYDLTGTGVLLALTGGLVTGPNATVGVGAGTKFVYGMIGRWLRLRDRAPFVIGLADRVSDAHIEAVLDAAALLHHPDAVTLSQQAQGGGGVAAVLRTRVQDVAASFSAELDSAVALLGYLATWPGGFATGGRRDLERVAEHGWEGCEVGAFHAYVAVGAIISAPRREPSVAGTTLPVADLTRAVGVTLLAAGLSRIARCCFEA